jgi:ABC-type branched-subunit amino acid transport system substrate-binding protein
MRRYRRDPAQVLRVGYRRNSTDVEAAIRKLKAHREKLRAVVMVATSRATALLKYQELLHRLAPGEKPDFVSLESYVSARILIEALQRAGRDLTMDRLVDAFEAIHGLDLGIGVPISFAPSEHQGSHKVWGTVLDGKGNFRALDLD